MCFQDAGNDGCAEGELSDGQNVDQENGQRICQEDGLPGDHGDGLLDGGLDLLALAERSDGRPVQEFGEGGSADVGPSVVAVVEDICGGHVEGLVDGLPVGPEFGPEGSLGAGLMVGD